MSVLLNKFEVDFPNLDLGVVSSLYLLILALAFPTQKAEQSKNFTSPMDIGDFGERIKNQNQDDQIKMVNQI